MSLSFVKRLATAAALLGMVVSTSGCFWLAVGDAGAPGYELARDDRSFGAKVGDASITTCVKSVLARDTVVSTLDINVDTYEGAV